MRFEKTAEFSIEALNLDTNNYRFGKGGNEQDCINKIYGASRASFANMMKSLAEADLDQELLVYLSPEGEPTVLDGNRRTAALKVLHDPSKAPTDSLQKLAIELSEECAAQFKGIRAQVTDNQDLALRTVYERHAAGKGISQISWAALANALFRFDQHWDNERDWKGMALLLEATDKFPDHNDFVFQGGYSHEVFRRVFDTAYNRDLFPSNLFSDRNERLHKYKVRLLAKAIDVIQVILIGMQAGDLSLSRKGDSYADKKKVEEFLEKHYPTTDKNAPPFGSDEPVENDDGQNSSGTGSGGDTLGEQGAESNEGEGPSDNSGPQDGGPDEQDYEEPKDPTRLILSGDIMSKLSRLKSRKLYSLARSFGNVSFQTNSVLVVIGAWAFIETIAKSLGSTGGTSLSSILNQKISEWFPDTPRERKKSYSKALQDIEDNGNCNKHCSVYLSINPAQLVTNFELLEPVILRALDELITVRESRDQG